MTELEKIESLIENYTMQIEFYSKKIDNFNFNDNLKNYEIRELFFNYALFVDKHNFYIQNFNKLNALKKIIMTGVVLVHQKVNIHTKIGTPEQEAVSLTEFLNMIDKDIRKINYIWTIFYIKFFKHYKKCMFLILYYAYPKKRILVNNAN